ncbi:MAG: carboxylating nicotinate-nucleotide diphosphorylase [Deltaproteobacteria bacterium]|nr:carboxylating nicotinate-nucleotide diphosphorylase [Deltaproteobacteria bacterium]
MNWPALVAEPAVRQLVDLAVAEDVGSGDVTTAAIFRAPQSVVATVVARRRTVVCGLPLFEAILRRFDPTLTVQEKKHEGSVVGAGEALCVVGAEVRAVLTAERTALNFLMHLCGVAAAAAAAVAAVPAGCKAKIYDTRKTTPGWRLLDKAAVLTGGACNHRFGLYDAVLIKDNHVAAAGSVARAVEMAKRHAAGALKIEVEVDRLDQLEEALAAGADIVLLDNMTAADMERAVRQVRGRALTEASGGVTLARIDGIARTGVDRISMGALTHTLVPADLSLEIRADGVRMVR